MIKSTIDNFEIKETTYPCLKQYKNSQGSYIVFFTSPNMGVCLKSNIYSINVGEQDEDHTGWAEKEFIPFTGSITLRNSSE